MYVKRHPVQEIVQTLTTNIFYRPRYSLVLMLVTERAFRVLKEKLTLVKDSQNKT